MKELKHFFKQGQITQTNNNDAEISAAQFNNTYVEHIKWKADERFSFSKIFRYVIIIKICSGMQ